MCGRARCTLDRPQLMRAAGVTGAPLQWIDEAGYEPRYNLAPGGAAPILHRDSRGQLVVQTMRWGLVPSFTKPDDKPDFWRMFNARSESVGEKPSFRRLLPGKRCVAFLEGFYEWKKDGKAGKQPYHIHLADGRPMAMACLYDVWHSADGEVHTFTVLTTNSGKRLAWLHDRMPVLLPDADAVRLWLATDDPASKDKVHRLLGPYDRPDLVYHPVTKAMSSPQFEGPEACEEVKKPSIQAFFQPKAPAAKQVAAATPSPAGRASGPAAPPTSPAGKAGTAVPAVARAEAQGPPPGPAAAANPDEAPSTGPAVAVEQEPGVSPAAVKEEPPSTVKGKGQKEEQDEKASPGVKRKSAEAGGVEPKATPTPKKARPPGQLDITSFYGKGP